MGSIKVRLKRLKDRMYYYFAEKNWGVRREYGPYVNAHKDEHRVAPWKHWFLMLRLNWHYRILRKKTYLINDVCVEKKVDTYELRYFDRKELRKTYEELLKELLHYDVISFDIFDTAIYRKVEYPNDVFGLMAIEMGHNDFTNVRKKAEQTAREQKEAEQGYREINLNDIYEILSCQYGIDMKWMDREIELELALSTPNPYIKTIYDRLLDAGKTIVFMTDMYLTQRVLEQMLERNGYTKYDKLIVSNVYGLRKGDGTLQPILLEAYPKASIVHVGDNKESDVDKSIAIGLNAIHNRDSNPGFRESDMDNPAGSFYRALINRTLHSGMWNENIHYEHGFRVGGILAAGFCEHINRVCAQQGIDKILFCGRDCDVIHQAYTRFFNQIKSEYIKISRYAIFNVTSERYMYDLSSRFIMRYMSKYRSEKTIGTILEECGFGYLVDYLEEEDIEQFLFPAATDQRKIENFILNHRNVVVEHNRRSTAAARRYFEEKIGDAKNILIVDVGWTGTCITALKYFLETQFPNRGLTITGQLMCTSRAKPLVLSVSGGELDGFVYSPLKDMDLTRYVFPGKGVSKRNPDLLHMPLEYLFTSTERSLVRYAEDENGDIAFEYASNDVYNAEEIQEMQRGVLDFIGAYLESTSQFADIRPISPYVAFNPLREAMRHNEYCCAVYGHFHYDAMTPPYGNEKSGAKFSELYRFSEEKQRELEQRALGKLEHDEVLEKPEEQVAQAKGNILFVTPELIYTGAPRSMLRMCKVALSEGYQVTVWSAKAGPFAAEYEAYGINVEIVPDSHLGRKSVVERIKSFSMAICNTIVTDKYAAEIEKYIPVVWYIREATNIPDFIHDNPRRLRNLQNSKNLYCVSDYAAEAISQYAKYKVNVVHNCVEDETEMALPYRCGSGEKVRFVQFGTIEYRKGYDVLLAAYLAMPEEYRHKAEVNFAGGFISSGTSYASYLFSKMKDVPNAHYLGLIQGERNKIETLSQMDVVVVASRDESCSLVALEGAMLSKPLIVTENVGAKYMVDDQNGFIVKTDDVEDLSRAMMRMIDRKEQLAEMGAQSRKQYERLASMETYTVDMRKLFSLPERRKQTTELNPRLRNSVNVKLSDAKVIVSLTSHPARIDTIHKCVESLLSQTVPAEKVILWLSKSQFSEARKELPESLLEIRSKRFQIRWVDEDLRPHKKYFYAAQEFPNNPIITVDDDVIYDRKLIETLVMSYRQFPDCVSCMRANLMMFRPDGNLRGYNKWLLGYTRIVDTPSYQLLPTGVGGVLYPPGAIPKEAFNSKAIQDTCLSADDLWLKVMTVHNGFRAVLPRNYCKYSEIPGTSESALWRQNYTRNQNDVAMENILDYYDEHLGDSKAFLELCRKDRFSSI